MKVKNTTNSHAHPTLIWKRLRRTSLGGGGEDYRREQGPGKDKAIDDRCISELVRSGREVEIQDVCSS